ncbi:YraN family protein [Nesterenkonia sp.]|uniref:YraN family protein n=1 Tax=Nesterenkonia sp. TaxID=704201 RepID=UPI00262136EB|nr:YraN family protein [Nesterenkonia sp.]
MRAKDRTGLIGEQLAADYLTARGHRLLARRWRSARGELDLITVHGTELVAVEVKTRRGTGFGDPLEAVDEQKLRRLHRLLGEYASGRRVPLRERRVDVVGVLLAGQGEDCVNIEHLQDVRL